MRRTAILVACYNRKDTTLRCLDMVTKMISNDHDRDYRVYLFDDGSTDGTGEAVRTAFPDVEQYNSPGGYYWSKSMHFLMEKAYSAGYDDYLMINDDVEFFDSALKTMYDCYGRTGYSCGIVGVCCSKDTGAQTYGGYSGYLNYSRVGISDHITECDVANWNCFLIPNEVIERVGFVDNKYEHGLGDFDYCLRMRRSGFRIYQTDRYIGCCDVHSIQNSYLDTTLSRIERLRIFFSKKGHPMYSITRYYVKNFGIRGFAVVLMDFFSCIFRIITSPIRI